MHDGPYTDAVETLAPELEALGRDGGASPDRGEESVALAGWVALCLSAFGEVSEEMLVGEGDAMARAADARDAMLGGARLALDALGETYGIDREAALSMVEDRLAAGGEFYTADELPPPSVDAELHAARLGFVTRASADGEGGRAGAGRAGREATAPLRMGAGRRDPLRRGRERRSSFGPGGGGRALGRG